MDVAALVIAIFALVFSLLGLGLAMRALYILGVNAGLDKKFETHPRHKNIGQVSHSKVLKIFEQSEIAVIPSRWEEPFGRTALEASSRGCATIISNRGGLTETTDSALVLSKTNPKILSKKLKLPHLEKHIATI